MATKMKPSPKLGANITIVRTDSSPVHQVNTFPTLSTSVNTLFPGLTQDRRESDAERYFTASSGDERDDDDDDDFLDDDDDDDDNEMCIMLDSDDEDADAGSLSGLHINLKTLQAVSNMLAHYTPIIQRDAKGNPVFVAPPPPPLEDWSPSITPSKGSLISPKINDIRDSPVETGPDSGSEEQGTSNPQGYDTVKNKWNREVEEFEMALQELENVIIAEEDNFLVDNMSNLVLDSMTYCAGEEIDDI